MNEEDEDMVWMFDRIIFSLYNKCPCFKTKQEISLQIQNIEYIEFFMFCF